MTTPGGVPNLPAGALTPDTLASKLQDMSTSAMRSRAADRMPGIFGGSSGGNPMSDLSPFGILTQIWAAFNSMVANADPVDIQGPEDLPDLLLGFIDELPVIGELVGLLEALMGTYDGDDEVLLQIQEIFGLIRRLLQLVGGTSSGSGFPSLGQVNSGMGGILGNGQNLQGLLGALNGDDPPAGSALPFTLPATLGAGGSGGPWRFFANLRTFFNVDMAASGFDLSAVLSNFTNTRLGGILNLFGGASNTTQAGNFMDNIKALFGNPTGMLSGSFDPGTSGASIPIPLLGNVLSLFGGASDDTEAGNFFTNLLSLFGNPTGMTGGSFTPGSSGAALPSGVGVPGGNIFGAGSVDFNAVNGLPATMINLQALQDLLPNIVNGTPTGAGQTPTDFGDAIRGLLDFITNGGAGTGDSGADGLSVFGALDALRATNVSNASAIADIRAQLVGSVYAVDEFKRSGSTPGADWSVNRKVGSAGTIGTDGEYLTHTSVFPGGAAEWLLRWLGSPLTTTASDYQEVVVVLGSAGGSSGGNYGHNGVAGRISSNEANYVYFLISKSGAWKLVRVVSGSETTMTSGSRTEPGAGATLRMYLGDLAATAPRKYRVTINGNDVFPGDGWYTESGTASMVGASYRGQGMYLRADGAAFSPQVSPGKVDRWLGMDQS